MSFSEILPGLEAPLYQSERLSRRQQGEQHGPHGPLMGTQKKEYGVNSSFVAPDSRLLSPSSSSSQYSIPSSSIFRYIKREKVSLDCGQAELIRVLVRFTQIILLNQHILVRLRSFINLFTLEQTEEARV
jgi:hypothetical protein